MRERDVRHTESVSPITEVHVTTVTPDAVTPGTSDR
jgi:hypothetical protein